MNNYVRLAEITKTALPRCDPTRRRTDPHQGVGILVMQEFGGGSSPYSI